MQKQEKNLKSSYDTRKEERSVSVSGSVNFRNIRSGHSQINISLDHIEMNETELGDDQLKQLFDQIERVIAPDANSNLSSEQREDLRYIIDGLHDRIRQGNQNNKQILRRFLRFLDNRSPEISQLVLDTLTKTK